MQMEVFFSYKKCISLVSAAIAMNTSADPEGGTGGPDPTWKITSYMGFPIGNKQLDPPWKMLDPLWHIENDGFPLKLTI